MKETQEEPISNSIATENYLKNQDPEAWKEIVGLSEREQNNLWFQLTQQHLGKYEQAAKLAPQAVVDLQQTKEFRKEEQQLRVLNYFGAKFLPELDPNLSQVGWISLPGKGFVKLSSLGGLIKGVLEVKQSVKNKPFAVMVTGVGIVGKATTRTLLSKAVMLSLPGEVVDNLDRDYQKMPPQAWPSDINTRIVEDVHGLDKNEQGVLERFDGVDGLPRGFDFVVYVFRNPKTYKQTLLNRGVAWARSGKIDLTAPDKKTPGTMDEALEEIARGLEQIDKASHDWHIEYLKTLKELGKRGVMTALVDPTLILKTLGYIKSIDDIQNDSFLGLLQKRVRIP